LQSKYGDFCEIQMGSKRLILVSNGDVAYPIHTSSVALSRKFLYRNVQNSGMLEMGFETSRILSNRNLDEWRINRKFFERISRSRNFLIMLTGKTYEMASDMGYNSYRNTLRVLSYFGSLGYEYHDYIPASEQELSLKLISIVKSVLKQGNRINVNETDWIDGEIFDPERFLWNKDSERTINARKVSNKGAFSTFGGGARICL
ncbi:11547_t:CDS:2, partial [Gigaspora margarita]